MDELLASGTGEALDASAITIDNVGQIETALASARDRLERDQLVRNIDNATAKVAQMEAHVADAAAAVATAEAELAAYDERSR